MDKWENKDPSQLRLQVFLRSTRCFESSLRDWNAGISQEMIRSLVNEDTKRCKWDRERFALLLKVEILKKHFLEHTPDDWAVYSGIYPMDQ